MSCRHIVVATCLFSGHLVILSLRQLRRRCLPSHLSFLVSESGMACVGYVVSGLTVWHVGLVKDVTLPAVHYVVLKTVNCTCTCNIGIALGLDWKFITIC